MSIRITDQLNNSFCFEQVPRRIVSLVPSQTELLAYLGLEEEVVGITKFCVHPQDWLKQKTKIGGTKKYHFDRIHALQPDLIIGNKEENEQGQIERLQQQYPVWMSDIKNVEDAYRMIEAIGQLTDRVSKAAQLVEQLKELFQQLAQYKANIRSLKTAYFIWQKPHMVAAAGTYIDQMLKLGGFDNVFDNKKRYPEVTEAAIIAANPEVILLSSEPFPFKSEHIQYFQSICPKAVIKLVDGELFSWYGNRMLYAIPYFIKLHKSLSK